MRNFYANRRRVFSVAAPHPRDVITFRAPATARTPYGDRAGRFGHHAIHLAHRNINFRRPYPWVRPTFHTRNWDSNPNMLFMHLLDTARNAGIASFTDATGTPVPSSQIRDNFAGSLLGSNPLVAPGTGNILLTQQSFTTTPRDFVYTFTADQLNILSVFISTRASSVGWIRCHFDNASLYADPCPRRPA